MTDTKCLSSSIIKKRIIRILKNEGISVKIKNDIVIFNKEDKFIEKKSNLLILNEDDLKDELNCQEYIESISTYIKLLFSI